MLCITFDVAICVSNNAITPITVVFLSVRFFCFFWSLGFVNEVHFMSAFICRQTLGSDFSCVF